MHTDRRQFFLWIAAIWIISVGFSSPLIFANSRYLYQEDDGHHFNHTVEMAQQRTLNPQYFNKPALHFYLRMPVVYASVAWERLRGRMKSVKELRTRDPYGLGNYAFTASHPTILRWNRFESATWSALLSVLVFIALIKLTQSTVTSLFGAALTTLSPEVLRNSYIIGVDTLMGLGCLSCAVFALMSLGSFTTQRLLLCSVIAGLACAAKYNAAPIVIVPFTLWLLSNHKVQRRYVKSLCIISLATSCGYLLGAPYSLLSFNRFVEGIGFEIWHYGVAGHEGASSEPGMEQATFYLRWLLSDGVGQVATGLSLLGAFGLFRKNPQAAILLVAFPVLYALLMISQKVHFTRNMLTIVPFVSIFAAYGLHTLGSAISNKLIRCGVIAGLLATSIIPLGHGSLTCIQQALAQVESRDHITDWITTRIAHGDDIAIAGPLQFPLATLSLSGVDAFNPERRSVASLIQDGYRFIVVPSNAAYSQTDLTTIALEVPGEGGQQRVPRNPAITILERKERSSLLAGLQPDKDMYPEINLTAQEGHVIPTCASHKEGHCWIQSRVSHLHIPAVAAPLSMTVMSPWANQQLEIVGPDRTTLVSTSLASPGAWQNISLPISRQQTNDTTLTLIISEVHSPASRGTGQDKRRLGIAIQGH